MVVTVLYVFCDVMFKRKAIPLITLVWVTMFVMKSGHINLSNYTKETKWRTLEIWQVMIAKRKIIQIWRSVLLLTNHPDATNIFS